MTRFSTFLLASTLILGITAIPGDAQITFVDVNPDNSDHDSQDPDGATGGRVTGLAIQADNNQIMYAASEWGGLYKSLDGGLIWDHLDGHLPMVTWDVEVDPGTPTRIYASSFYDGKTDSKSGVNISNDGGATWTRPASVDPPAGFCLIAADETEPTAFGISIDPLDNSNVFVGTSCGLALSNDSGATWTYRDPTAPAGSATRIWDVLAQGNDVIHVCGDDGYLRSTDGGNSWVAGTGLPSGRCSLAASPDESYVLFAVVGTSIFETNNAGGLGSPTWTQTRSNLSPQGRIPFVATNQRSDNGADNVFDLWFGDVSLFRVSCTTPTPPAPGGSPRCGAGNNPAWSGPFTRAVGGHDDMGGILFDSEAANDACPVLMSSDGGVYYNTDGSGDCHNPNWEQPDVTPHALWPFAMAGVDRAGSEEEDLYFGNQDNGLFGTIDAGSAEPTWHNEVCCDGFDATGDPDGGLFSICCFGGGGRANRVFRTDPAFFNSNEINNYPPGGLSPTFDFPDSIANFGGRNYVMVTRDCNAGAGGCPANDGGVFITADIDANPIVWTELGNATEPPTGSICGVQVAVDGNTPTFFVQTGSCNNTSVGDRFFRYTGTAPNGNWTELFLPNGGFGVLAVKPTDSSRLLASGLVTDGAAMFSSSDGGANWSSVPALDALMTGNGAFAYRNQRGPTNFTGFSGYWQPSLVAFDGASDLVIAGGQESGLFLSNDDGATWQLITDPLTSDVSGIPHLPRPRYAYFDSEPSGEKNIYIGSQGRGIWRLSLSGIFADGFESGDTSSWSSTSP